MTKRLVIHSGNPVYGFKGTLFHRDDHLGNRLVHEVEDDFAAELTADENSPFRELDENDEVIETEADTAARKAAEESENARTFTVPQPHSTTDVVQDPSEAAPETKTKKITISSKKAGSGDLSVADLQANGGTPAGTEGAVEV